MWRSRDLPYGVCLKADQEQTGEQRGRKPLQVDGCGGQVGLDLHVGETAPDSARQAMPGLRLAVVTFRAPAVALVEAPVLL